MSAASSALCPYPKLRRAPRACLWGWRLGWEESWGQRALFLISDLFFITCLYAFKIFFFLILEKHGSENNFSAALDIKMKNN